MSSEPAAARPPSARRIPAPLAAACPGAVRLAGPADSVAGVRPSYVAAPASTQQASALLGASAALDLAAVPRGTGTRLHWGAPPRRCDLVIETSRLNRVTEHAAGDLVATAQAGVGLDALAGVLGAAGQRLALDPPGGTVGGILATGAAGPLRLRYGTPRDLVIGITVVRADGVIARSGGKVVKNVAGYDLGKLFAGSYGTLGLITEATFRLHPVPVRTAFVTAAYADAGAACRALASAAAAPLDPVAAELDWPGQQAPVTIAVAMEGDHASVPERASRLAGLLGGAHVGGEPPPWWGADPGAGRGGTLIRLSFWVGDLPAVLAAIAAAAGAAGLQAAVRGSAAAGVLDVALAADADPALVADLLARLRAAAGHVNGRPRGDHASGADGRPPVHGSAVVLSAPPGVRELIDPWGPVSSLALMRAVKQQFDPRHLMAPGRLAGGI